MGGLARDTMAWRPAGQKTPQLRKDLWEEAHQSEGILHPNAQRAAEGDDGVAELLQRMQSHIYPRGIRVSNFFMDYNKHRTGRCTRAQFGRAISQSLPPTLLTTDEVKRLAEHFSENSVTHWQTSTRANDGVNFVKFCRALDEGGVALDQAAHSRKQATAAKEAPLPAGFKPAVTDDEARLSQIIQRIAALMKARNHDKFCRFFEKVEKRGQLFPQKSGKITPVHFMQNFPFLRDFSAQDVKLIMQRYTEESGGVNVKAMTVELEEAIENLENLPGPSRSASATALAPGMVRRQRVVGRSTSEATLRPSTSPATIGRMTVERLPAGKGGFVERPTSAAARRAPPTASSAALDGEAALRPSSAFSSSQTNARRKTYPKDVDTFARVRSFLAERDIRIVDRFMDYDRLRKGVCTMNQAFSVFAIAGLKLGTKDHDTLLHAYHDESGRFRYRDFLKDVTQSGEESSDGKPAFDKRKMRHPGVVEGEGAILLEGVLDRLQRQVTDRGMEIRTLFDDFRVISGICSAGHVTRAQFSRIMSMLNFKVTEPEMDVLNRRFGDTDDSEEFNYLDFCNVIDPGPPAAERCLNIDTPPYVPFKVNHYFDASGRVIPQGSLPGLGGRTKPSRLCH